jgi:hypothetical protein
VQLTMKPNEASMTEMRSLTASEIDQTSGGVVWILPIVLAAAVVTYLASQKKQ